MKENILPKIYTVISEEQSDKDRPYKKTPLYIGVDLDKAKEIMSREIKKLQRKIEYRDWVESWKEEEYVTTYKGFTQEGKYYWYQVTLTENRPIPQFT